MASTAERNAAFDGVKEQLIEFVRALMPSFLEQRGEDWINDPEHTDKILAIVDAALGPAERVRKKAEGK